MFDTLSCFNCIGVSREALGNYGYSTGVGSVAAVRNINIFALSENIVLNYHEQLLQLNKYVLNHPVCLGKCHKINEHRILQI